MARNIDADKLRRRVKEKTNPYGKPTLDYESGVKVLNMIDNAPTADVAPRAEVAMDIFEEMDRILLPLLHEVSQVYIYVKLKRKYTQSEPPKGD